MAKQTKMVVFTNLNYSHIKNKHLKCQNCILYDLMGCELKLTGLTSELSLNVLNLMSAASGRRKLHTTNDLLEEIFVKRLEIEPKEAIC